MKLPTLLIIKYYYSRHQGVYSSVCQEYPIHTGKSLSEALVFASTNPQYENRLFIELQVQYMKISSSEHVVYSDCFLF